MGKANHGDALTLNIGQIQIQHSPRLPDLNGIKCKCESCGFLC